MSVTKAGVRPDHAPKLARLLTRLDVVTGAPDRHVPGWKLHPLTDDLKDHWAVSVNGKWRMTFTFDGTDAVLVDYMDYHWEQRNEPYAQPTAPRPHLA